MQPLVEPGARLLAVTSVDLYVPVLTFVFGEAQLSGGVRLRPGGMRRRRSARRCPTP